MERLSKQGEAGKTSRLSREQIQLHLAGVQRVRDILSPHGNWIAWERARAQEAPNQCWEAFLKLTTNLSCPPAFEGSSTPKEFYVEECNPVGPQLIWKYLLPPYFAIKDNL